jgi:hypothetical protein
MGKSVSNIPLVVGLTDNEVQAIAATLPGPQAAGEKVAEVGARLVKQYAQGAALLPAEWAARIEAALGTLDPRAVAEAVEKAMHRQGEAVVVEWVVDPTQIAFYQMLAENAGLSLERQLKSMLDYAYSQGWFGMGAPDADKILLTPEQYRALQRLFGKDIVTGEDVMERLQEADGAGFIQAEEEEDPILGSLDR